MRKKAKRTKAPDQNPLPKLELYYDIRDGSLWYCLGGRWISPAETKLQLHFRTLGFSDCRYITQGKGAIKEIDWPIWNAMNNHQVDFTGSLAGHRKGIFKDGAGRSFLVTEEASGVFDAMPKKIVEPEFFCAFLLELLPGEQWRRFCYWLAVALTSLRAGDYRPGQILVLAGPPACGKSLLQYIITEVLGGRASNPFKYMMEKTQFNKDLCGAEHWMIEDPPTSIDIRTRREFGCNLKNCAFTRDFPVHPKGRDIVPLPLFRRVSISVNRETENLAVIPPLEEGIDDKLTLLSCERVVKAFERFPADQDGNRSRTEIWAKVMEEIPMIRAWLLNAFKRIPAGWRDERCLVGHWHHPDLEAELRSLAPEHRMLQLLDHAFFQPDPEAKTAAERAPVPITDKKAFDLEQELAVKMPAQVGSLSRMANWLGTYLGKLLKAGNTRISKRVKDGTTLWTIKPPVRNED